MRSLSTSLICRRCGHKGVPRLEWRRGRGVVHLGGYCKNCGEWIRWLPQVTPWVDLAQDLEDPRQPGLFEGVGHA